MLTALAVDPTETVLVCGGRSYADRAHVRAVLDELAPGRIIEGGASGADAIARSWARRAGVPCITVPAEWARYGRAAGPLRNARMLAECAPTLVLAFPGGRGTADMVRRAREAGVPVREVSPC